MSLTLLHTSEAHRKTFDMLRDRLAPGLSMTQEVRSDWLERAQSGITDPLADEIAQKINTAPGPVLCTCTTIGPAAEAAGAMRIDWPMMQQAARIGGPILMAYCLESTWAPSLALLERALRAKSRKSTVHPLPLLPYWALFDAGEYEAFEAVIAGEIRQVVETGTAIGCVVLAQASMAGAASRLMDLNVPVLASPELAFQAAIAKL